MTEEEYYDKLVGKEECEKIFKEFKNPTIEFLYKSTRYTYFRFFEEFAKDSNKWEISGKALNQLHLGKIEFDIPFTMQWDILFFELNTFFNNVIRVINFCLGHKLKNYDHLNPKNQISISSFILKSEDCAYKNTLFFEFFKEEYNKWISRVNVLRNNVIHGEIITTAEGRFKVKAELKEGKINKEEKRTLGIGGYQIKDLEEFVKQTMGNLDNFLTEFIKKLLKK